jgi:hypothetical protein
MVLKYSGEEAENAGFASFTRGAAMAAFNATAGLLTGICLANGNFKLGIASAVITAASVGYAGLRAERPVWEADQAASAKKQMPTPS